MVLIAFVVLIMLSVLPPVHIDIAILHHIRRTLYVKDIPAAIAAACLWVIKQSIWILFWVLFWYRLETERSTVCCPLSWKCPVFHYFFTWTAKLSFTYCLSAEYILHLILWFSMTFALCFVWLFFLWFLCSVPTFLSLFIWFSCFLPLILYLSLVFTPTSSSSPFFMWLSLKNLFTFFLCVSQWPLLGAAS